jgi:hypothetical protein
MRIAATFGYCSSCFCTTAVNFFRANAISAFRKKTVSELKEFFLEIKTGADAMQENH